MKRGSHYCFNSRRGMGETGGRVGGGGVVNAKARHFCEGSTVYKDTTGCREKEKSIFDLLGQIQHD
jgi:hypothetical protein